MAFNIGGVYAAMANSVTKQEGNIDNILKSKGGGELSTSDMLQVQAAMAALSLTTSVMSNVMDGVKQMGKEAANKSGG